MVVRGDRGQRCPHWDTLNCPGHREVEHTLISPQHCCQSTHCLSSGREKAPFYLFISLGSDFQGLSHWVLCGQDLEYTQAYLQGTLRSEGSECSGCMTLGHVCGHRTDSLTHEVLGAAVGKARRARREEVWWH